MTNPEIPAEAREVAWTALVSHMREWHEDGSVTCKACGYVDDGPYGWPKHQADIALAAALPHLRVQETPAEIPDTLANRQAFAAGARWADAQRAQEQATPTPHPRPVVDREAVAVVLRSHYRQHGPGIVSGKPFEARCSCRAEYGHGKFFDHLADAVLALLPTEEGEGS